MAVVCALGFLTSGACRRQPSAHTTNRNKPIGGGTGVCAEPLANRPFFLSAVSLHLLGSMCYEGVCRIEAVKNDVATTSQKGNKMSYFVNNICGFGYRNALLFSFRKVYIGINRSKSSEQKWQLNNLNFIPIDNMAVRNVKFQGGEKKVATSSKNCINWCCLSNFEHKIIHNRRCKK